MKIFALAAAVAALAAFAPGAFAHEEPQMTGTHGVDLGYLMSPNELQAFSDVRGADELDEIIRVGARALDWVDVLQKDVPPETREQIWRRSDRIGHEPTFDKAMTYNPAIILEMYRKAMSDAPAAVREVLTGNGAVPANPPAGLSIKNVVDAVRTVHTAYSRASRWLMLYGWRFALGPSGRDFRGWLRIRQETDALVKFTEHWNTYSEAERGRFIDEVCAASPLSGGSVERCRSENAELSRAPDGGNRALAWLRDVLSSGQRDYDTRFGVRSRHEGVRLSTEGATKMIAVPTTGIESGIYKWIEDRVREAWNFNNAVGVSLFETSGGSGAVRVIWEKGALPHVNGIAGDTITMDSNTPKWLEHTQVTMRHEFGHVLGFADCYTEFWDEEKESFIYYTLDPSDAMCALSGGYFDRHRDALLAGYF
jgi:hypothetical protein